jgi:acetyltransferase (GNAT) family protein
VVDYRPITPADLDSCIEIFYAADEQLTAERNLPLMPRNPQSMQGIFTHVTTYTPGRAWLAEESGNAIGFGMAVEREDLVFLSFLFVSPKAQAAGVGTALYERCVPRSGFRATSIWSLQPISAALYARDGVVPRVPLYTFLGRPRTPLPLLADGLELTAIKPDELDELDREVLGFSRRVDHLVWQAWDRRPFGLRAQSDVIGYGYAQPSGRVGPVVVRRSVDLLPLVGELMRQFEPPGEWMVHVPGPAADSFALLLRAGMRMDGAPVIFCATEDRIDHSRYLPGTFALP